eukprot:2591443-Rhodomonas_salina.5
MRSSLHTAGNASFTLLSTLPKNLRRRARMSVPDCALQTRRTTHVGAYAHRSSASFAPPSALTSSSTAGVSTGHGISAA